MVEDGLAPKILKEGDVSPSCSKLLKQSLGYHLVPEESSKRSTLVLLDTFARDSQSSLIPS